MGRSKRELQNIYRLCYITVYNTSHCESSSSILCLFSVGNKLGTRGKHGTGIEMEGHGYYEPPHSEAVTSTELSSICCQSSQFHLLTGSTTCDEAVHFSFFTIIDRCNLVILLCAVHLHLKVPFQYGLAIYQFPEQRKSQVYVLINTCVHSAAGMEDSHPIKRMREKLQ